jgi:acyl dehydratase
MGGPATELVHPGVLHVLAFPVSLSLMARGDFPVSLLGLVHVRNRVLQHRPVRVGEKIDVECRTRNLRPHRRGRTFEAVTTFHAADGTIVATDVSTYLAKDKKVSKVIAGGGSGTEGADASSAKRPSFVPQMPTARWSLGADAGRRYAEVSGDANPIHMSALTAKAFGFPRAVAHGMYTASRAFTESRVDRSRPLQWDVEFKTPVILPATVLVRFEDQPDSGGVTCEGWRAGRRDKPARLHFRVDVRTLD